MEMKPNFYSVFWMFYEEINESLWLIISLIYVVHEIVLRLEFSNYILAYLHEVEPNFFSVVVEMFYEEIKECL